MDEKNFVGVGSKTNKEEKRHSAEALTIKNSCKSIRWSVQWYSIALIYKMLERESERGGGF